MWLALTRREIDRAVYRWGGSRKQASFLMSEANHDWTESTVEYSPRRALICRDSPVALRPSGHLLGYRAVSS